MPEIRAGATRRTIIGVMGPGETSRGMEVLAYELGALIAREGWILLTGGRRRGVMDAASRGAKSVPGSLTVGILPDDHDSPDVSDAVDIAIFTNMGDARNAINVQSSDVVVACGVGTAGTLSEVALALKAGKDVVLLGATDDAQRFLRTCGGSKLHVAHNAAQVIERSRLLTGRKAI